MAEIVRVTDFWIPAVNTVGIDWIDVGSDGTAIVHWPDPSPFSLPNGDADIVHGGLVTMVADSAMAWALYGLEDPPAFLTGDLRVEFIRATPATAPVVAAGRVVRRTRRVVFCSAQVMSQDQSVVYAEARATQVVVGPIPESERMVVFPSRSVE